MCVYVHRSALKTMSTAYHSKNGNFPIRYSDITIATCSVTCNVMTLLQIAAAMASH